MTSPRGDADWTPGPAKWAAVFVLGAASIGGLVWSNTSRVSHVTKSAAAGEKLAAASPRDAKQTTVGEKAGPDLISATPIETQTVAGLLDINTASAAELELLPEIGPALAGRIVEYRKTNGPFRTVEGLTAVRGIGPKTFSKIRAHVTVVPPPPDDTPTPE